MPPKHPPTIPEQNESQLDENDPKAIEIYEFCKEFASDLTFTIASFTIHEDKYSQPILRARLKRDDSRANLICWELDRRFLTRLDIL